MKRKVKKVKAVKEIKLRIAGFAYWRITGPSSIDGKRVSVVHYGKREDMDEVILK